jgi:hypothetical protein
MERKLAAIFCGGVHSYATSSAIFFGSAKANVSYERADAGAPLWLYGQSGLK